MKKYPELTKLKINKLYEAVETYPHEGRRIGIEINNYIKFKDLPKNVQDIIDDGLSYADGYNIELYDNEPCEFEDMPFAIGTGTNGYHYIMIPLEEGGSEAISVDKPDPNYFDIKL